MSFEPHDPLPRWGEVGIHGVHRPREWDVVVVAEAPGLAGDEHRFALAGPEPADPALAPLAAAVAEALAPPFRAHAVRRAGGRWSVGARRIEVVELPDGVPGEEIVLSFDGRDRVLEIDGLPAFRDLPELERLAAARHETWVVRATRIGARAWEVAVSPL